jgi:hypothetical protein
MTASNIELRKTLLYEENKEDIKPKIDLINNNGIYQNNQNNMDNKDYQFLNQMEKNIIKLGYKIDNEISFNDNLKDSFDILINKTNNFYRLIDNLRKDEEKLNEKFYIKFICCFCCCKKCGIKKTINSRIEEVEKLRSKQIYDKLEKIRDNYMSKKPSEPMKISTIISSIQIYFLILSFLHFFAIAEVDSILFSLFGELKREIIFKIKEKYRTNKTFYTFFEKSTLNDSSQINFNFLFSFLALYFIGKLGITKLYSMSIIFIFLLIFFISIFNFLSQEEINTNKIHYDISRFITLIIIYLSIYFFASLISLIPHYIIFKDGSYNFYSLLLINLILTLGVIVKGLIHWSIFFLKLSNFLNIMICDGFFFITSLIFILIFHYKIENNIKIKNDNDENINTEEIVKNNESKKNIEEAKSNNNIINNNCIEDFNDKLNMSYDDIKLSDIDHKRHKKLISSIIKFDYNKKINYSSYYFCGYLTIKFNDFIVSIKIKELSDFILSLIKNVKFDLIIIINFLSRAQKLKFKELYKNSYDESLWFMLLLNFLLSYFMAYFSLIIFYYINEKDQNEKDPLFLKKKENFIIILMIIDSSIVLMLSCINLGFPHNDICNKLCSFFAISFGGTINFLFYEYYSTTNYEYISLSGFISIGQIIFRLLELLCSFEENYFFKIQIVCSILSILLLVFYLFPLKILNFFKKIFLWTKEKLFCCCSS